MHEQSRMRAIMALALLLNLSMSLPQQAAGAASMYDPRESERSPGAMAIDALAVRPLGIIATALGAGLFVVSLPFSALGGNVGEAAETLVVKPARFTFVRPLGEYDAHY